MFKYIVCILLLLALFNVLDADEQAVKPKSTAVDAQFMNEDSTEQEEDNVSTRIQRYLKHNYYETSLVSQKPFEDIRQKGVRLSLSDYDDLPHYRKVLSWNFPFFGHNHREIWVNANGFISLQPRTDCHHTFCNWDDWDPLSSKYIRYIAPFMTDLNPRASGEVHIYEESDPESYNIDRLVLQWTDVSLYRRFPEGEPKVYPVNRSFTFQVEIRSTGDILFNYYRVPFNPLATAEAIVNNDRVYPLTIGLEDAALVPDVEGNLVYRKYQPLDIDFKDVKSLKTIEMRAMPTCVSFRSCKGCLSSVGLKDFQCSWCAASQTCTDYLGRELEQVSSFCPRINLVNTTNTDICDHLPEIHHKDDTEEKKLNAGNTGLSGSAQALITILVVFTIAFIVSMIFCTKSGERCRSKFSKHKRYKQADELGLGGSSRTKKYDMRDITDAEPDEYQEEAERDHPETAV